MKKRCPEFFSLFEMSSSLRTTRFCSRRRLRGEDPLDFLGVAANNCSVNIRASDFRMMLQNTMRGVRTSGVSCRAVREEGICTRCLQKEIHQIRLTLFCSRHVSWVLVFGSL